MMMFDKHPHILAWASEPISINYRNPLTGNWVPYIPDFFVVYVDKSGNKYCELLEVKPLKETPGFVKVSKKGKVLGQTEKEKATQVINAAKWSAALAYCAKRGWTFRVITEESLFVGRKQ